MSLGTRYVLALTRCPAQCALPRQLQQQHLILGTSSPSLPAHQKLLRIQTFIQRQSNWETRIELRQEKLSSLPSHSQPKSLCPLRDALNFIIVFHKTTQETRGIPIYMCSPMRHFTCSQFCSHSLHKSLDTAQCQTWFIL